MMHQLPESLRKVIHDLKELPSIGPRQATRLALYLIRSDGPALAEFGEHIEALRHIKRCEQCFFIHENTSDLCDICEDARRDTSRLLLVEKETDLMSIEATRRFTGLYLVLGEIAKTGILEEWQKKRLHSLKTFIARGSGGPSTSSGQGKAKEIIIGFNPTSFGDFHASLITKELEPYAEKISRLGRGLPVGGEIEFADEETLGSALEGRS